MQGGFLLRRPPVATKGWGGGGRFVTGDTVVVPRIDRLARNLTEGLKTIEELHDKGINIRSLAERLDTGDDSPTSRLMLHMLLSLAEWERDTIRDRIRAGVDRAAAEGRTGGRTPDGRGERHRGSQQRAEQFLPRFNQRFRVPPQYPEPAFRPLNPVLCLEKVCASSTAREWPGTTR